MTPKEALKVIDKVHDYPCPYGIGGTAWLFIRNCIEKQMLKKPYVINDEWAKCPSCKSNMINHRKPHFCECCGQALDWSKSNDR